MSELHSIGVSLRPGMIVVWQNPMLDGQPSGVARLIDRNSDLAKHWSCIPLSGMETHQLYEGYIVAEAPDPDD